VPTEKLEQQYKDSTLFKIDFPTAIAISGAAASSNMGSESIKPMSFTLALFNVRLGYWFPNPKTINDPPKAIDSLWTFVKEAFGYLDEENEIVYLTDGGHIENLGIYELLRRRCQLIIAIDSEADRQMTFPSFIKLQRYARIDLGARIEMDWDQIAATSLKVQKRENGKNDGPHCAVGRIEYDKGGTGILLYVKASVTGDENDYIRDYNRRYADFPHETTSDQFFSEEQFEVYRALGFHAVAGALSGKHKVQTLPMKPAQEAEAKSSLERLCDPQVSGFGIRQLQEILALQVKPVAAAPAPTQQSTASVASSASAPRARRRSRG
jgi:hypothetical protein